MAVELLQKEYEPEYLQYIENHPLVTLEFLWGWRDLLQQHFKFIPKYLVRRNTQGIIDGVLPLFLTESIFGRRLVSIPYAVSAGVLADSEKAAQELVYFAEQLARQEKVSFLEIREQKKRDWFPSSFVSSETVSSFSLSLSSPIDEVWKKLPKGSVRWGIKKAGKSGLTWDYGTSREYLDHFYDLFLHTRKHRGVPAYPYAYLKGILNLFGDNARIYLARHQGKVIAAIFLLYYKKEVRYAFAGARQDIKTLQLQPYHLLLWEAIKDACANGYTQFNFGGAAIITNDGGLYDFKRKWADTIVPISSYFYLKEGQTIPSQEGTMIKIAARAWKHLPRPVIKAVSPYVIRQFV